MFGHPGLEHCFENCNCTNLLYITTQFGQGVCQIWTPNLSHGIWYVSDGTCLNMGVVTLQLLSQTCVEEEVM